MSDLGEVEAAVRGARRACCLSVAVTMSFDTAVHTMMGASATATATGPCSGPEGTDRDDRHAVGAFVAVVAYRGHHDQLDRLARGDRIYAVS